MAQKSRSQYVMSLLNVLQKNNSSITKVEAVEQVIKDLKIDDEELSKLTPTGASKVTTEIGWARQGLCYGGYIDNSQRGIWALTEKGKSVDLKILDSSELLQSIHKGFLDRNVEITRVFYQQKILFGSPGTGKSYQIDKHIIPYELLIDVEKMPANVIKTVFHPEYTYGDFVGKLMPITVGNNVQYKFYEGHFLKALSQAYKNIIAAQENDSEIEKVALVIDEINRGNSAAIFGTIFQLLDREPDGWSSYEVSVNEIIFNRLLELCDLTEHANVKGKGKKVTSYLFGEEEIKTEILQKKLLCNFENRTIKIPPNLSILASMNTSDSSIYYMDSAFKRRWEWEFIDVDSNTVSAEGVAFENRDEWKAFVGKLNAFIKSNHKSIRGIEDKQIGHFFITDDVIQKSSVQNKLMFFLWDSVFNRDKKPLIKLLFDDDKENELITFGDFATQVDLFIDKINGHV
jgi:5-methylcytosine-specific restriction enzyme B